MIVDIIEQWKEEYKQLKRTHDILIANPVFIGEEINFVYGKMQSLKEVLQSIGEAE